MSKNGNIFSKWISLIKNKKKNYIKNNDKNIVTSNKDFTNDIVNYKSINNIEHDNSKTNDDQKIYNVNIKNNFITKLKEKLNKTRINFGITLKKIFLKNKIDATLFDSLEEKLLISDIGVETTNFILHNLKLEVKKQKISDVQEVYTLLKHQMLNILSKVEKPIKIQKHIPFIILVVGINGSGKTTTIGKLVNKYKKMNKSVILAAADTFRAAAIEQLQEWGIKNKISVIAPQRYADPASVAFDAIKAAQSRNIDILIIDTAGRLHNKINLMEELKKIKKVIKKIDVHAPHEIMLVIDSCNGQNAIRQTEFFHKHLNITGMVLTKLDSTAKGGVIFPIARKFSIPIRYISIGETIHDLKTFNCYDFIQSIF